MPTIDPQKHDKYLSMLVDSHGYKPSLNVNTNFDKHFSALAKHYDSIKCKLDNPCNHFNVTNENSSLAVYRDSEAASMLSPLTMGDYYDVEFFERDDTQVYGEVDFEEFLKGDLYIFGKSREGSYAGKCNHCGKKLGWLAHKDGVIQGHMDEEGVFRADQPCPGLTPTEIIIDVPSGVLTFFEYINDEMLDQILQYDSNRPYQRVAMSRFFEKKNIAHFNLREECSDILKFSDTALQIRGELYYSDKEFYEQYGRYTRETLLNEEWPLMENKIVKYHEMYGEFDRLGYCSGNTRNYTVCDEEVAKKLYLEYERIPMPEQWDMIDARVAVQPGRYKITAYTNAPHPLDANTFNAQRYDMRGRGIYADIVRIGDIDDNV